MFSNANSFKAKIKNMAKDRGIPAQQLQQNFLIEQVLKLIAKSSYKDSFIVKGGYLIGQLIGLDKRTTMDLDVTLKGTTLSQENLITIFEEILSDSDDVFSFEVDKLEPIRQDDEYGGFSLKLNATFDTLREVVFIDITTGDKITPREITYSMSSLFANETIEVWTYNLETVLAEKLETIIIDIWESQLNSIETDEYQKQLWTRYQRQFKYAQDISFEKSVQIVKELMTTIM